MRNWNTLIEPEELVTQLERSDLVILDCRFSLGDSSYGEKEYERGHLPGARYANLDSDLSGIVIPGSTGRHPLPGTKEAESMFRRLGVRNDSQVIAYDDFGGAFAARLWWMLNWLGHDHVAVLNGGWPAWIVHEYLTESGMPDILKESLESGVFLARPRPGFLITSDEIDAVVADPNRVLVDARAYERYLGASEPIDAVAGHIPGAKSLPFRNNLSGDDRFLAPDRLREIWSAVLEGANTTQVVSYCGSGVTGAHNILALQYAGMGTPALYAGSWSEWITRPNRAIATGPENSGSESLEKL